VPLLKPDDILWVHDYHLIPFAEALRRRGVENAIGFFLHIPVPPWQTFLAIPEHRELARAISAYDLVGLQTKADVSNLIKFLEDGAEGRILQDGRIRVFERELAVESFPVGIDVTEFDNMPAGHGVLPDGPKRIIGVDRLDYTKGLPQKLASFGRFLEKYPEYRGQVVLSQIAPPTRESVEAYTDIRRTLEALSGKINGMFGELDWVPIHYIHRSAPRKKLRDIYRNSRIGFFTPLRDGMNLVAKEYIAAQDPADPGVVILSRFAGAAEQLVDALIVNPYNVDEMADAIRTALVMNKAERIARHLRLLAAIRGYDTTTWHRSFLTALESGFEKRGMATANPSIHAALETLQRSISKKEQGYKGGVPNG
jgi:trehalose 6-phosphate synthase